MKLSPEYSSIIADASPLSDRIEGNYVSATSDETSERLRARWQNILSGLSLSRRIEWSDSDESQVRDALGTPEITDANQLPEWAENAVLLCEASFDELSSNKESAHRNRNIPFGELYKPVLEIARSRLEAAISCQQENVESAFADTLSTDAYRSLELSLIHRLAQVASRALLAEFNLVRPKGYELLALSPLSAEQLEERKYYDRFIESFTTSGYVPFFAKYPVIARLWSTLIIYWVEHVAEFVRRLREDTQDLSSVFGSDEPLGRVEALNAGISDPHHRGRSVILLKFECGVKVVYKPRSSGLDQAYADLGSWLKERGAPFPIEGLVSLDKDTHGWVEFVEHAECKEENTARFFENAGALLALHYVLGTTDCHHENLIARGDRWQLIDLETLLHHESQWDPVGVGSPNAHLEHELLTESVLGLGILPQWQIVTGQNSVRDGSGLGSLIADADELRVPRWFGLGSDYIQIRTVREKEPRSNNLPQAGDKVPSPYEHQGSIQIGFEKTYQFLQRLAPELLSEDSPLAAMRKHHVRFVFRDTMTYTLLSHRTLAPEYLKDGAARSIEIEALSRAFLQEDNKPVYWPLLEAEQHALENLDIPHFSARTDSVAIEPLKRVRVDQFFTKSAFERMQKNLRSMCDADLELQSKLIAGSFYSHMATAPGDEGPQVPSRHHDTTDEPSLSFVEHAFAISDQLQKDALIIEPTKAQWIGFEYVANVQRFRMTPMQWDLYSGRGGLALFFAALYRVTGEKTARGIVQSIVAPLLRLLERPGFLDYLIRRMTVGGASGMGSIVYWLSQVAELADHPELYGAARQIALQVPIDRLESEKQLDVINGVAGWILGLYPMLKRDPDPRLIKSVAAAGQTLLTTQQPNGAWPTAAKHPPIGLAHGVAGCALALNRTFDLTADERFREAAKRASAFRIESFNEPQRNWPDWRPASIVDGRPAFVRNWCTGAAGICSANLDNEDTQIDQALEIVSDEGSLDWSDAPCCGNMGRVDALLEAGRRSKNEQLAREAGTIAKRVIGRATASGGYTSVCNVPRWVASPSFHQGLAGVGYTLLRLVEPNLPSVLIWESSAESWRTAP